jgi:hypothetical protein
VAQKPTHWCVVPLNEIFLLRVRHAGDAKDNALPGLVEMRDNKPFLTIACCRSRSSARQLSQAVFCPATVLPRSQGLGQGGPALSRESSILMTEADTDAAFYNHERESRSQNDKRIYAGDYDAEIEVGHCVLRLQVDLRISFPEP